ncbi:hypothetical protein GGF46_001348 [Coemansia sp. RSA 552]|nr:hypothetical protein GGF46_001348 [Coemansia sp. RSA 552]
MKLSRHTLVLASTCALGLGLPIDYGQLSRQVAVVSETLPIISLGYLKEAASAYHSARAGFSRLSHGLMFGFANLPPGPLDNAHVSSAAEESLDSLLELGSLEVSASDNESSSAEISSSSAD